MKNSLGKVHVYTGDGHGKTTSALGVALRAIGHDYKVHIIQFMKGKDDIGEYLIKGKLASNLKFDRFGTNNFIRKDKESKKDIELAKKGMKCATEVMEAEKPDILILDELNVALYFNLLKIKEVLNFIDTYSDKGIEIIITGRKAPKELLDRADLVTEMKNIKHYFDKGQNARRGIEY